MKLLYLSCHSILEHDEIKLFNELEIDVFSYGTYRNPKEIDDKKRPILDLPFHKELFDLTKDGKHENINQKVIDWADVIVCMHRPDWLLANWSKFKGKRVIFRAIGQNIIDTENILKPLRRQGLEIVRYSPREQTIPGFAGEDALIRFYKDPAEFGSWTGEGKFVLNITQDMKQRGGATNFQFWDESTKGFPRILIGKGGEEIGPEGLGIVDYEVMKQKLRECGVYFYTGTYPASYVLNLIEALMTGCPIVALGEIMGNDTLYPEMRTYEVADFAKQTSGILLADDIGSARGAIQRILEGGAEVEQMSVDNRALAIKLFGKEEIKAQWGVFLKDSHKNSDN